ncbi:MAG: hypothetical protein EBU84_04180 [Actinobacteria bacterium]|nr:hypothetical protein [Actinomycetota bacterium]
MPLTLALRGGPASAVATCPGGGTTTEFVSGLNVVSGSTSLDRTSPANIVTNGDFTTEPAGLAASAYPYMYYWGESGRNTKTKSGVAYTTLNAQIPSWNRSGGSPVGTDTATGTYAFWTKKSDSTGMPNSIPPLTDNGQSIGRVYFGNSISASISPIARFDANGISAGPYTITPATGYGTDSTPAAIDQSVPTMVGTKYRMYFAETAEVGGSFVGISALEITGYPRVYFEVVPTNRSFTFEFTATTTSTNIKFMSWGHLQSGGENFRDIVTRSATSSIMTLTTNGDHGYTAGQLIAISGVGARYDTTMASVYTVPATNKFTVILGGASESSTSTSGFSFKPVSGLSAELVLDDVIINECIDPSVPTTTTTTTTTTLPPTAIRAVNDAQTTPWDTDQTYRPLVNDSASGGALIVASTLRLCPTTVSSPFTRAKCTATSVTVPGEGVYTLSGSTVVFDPEPTFSGTVSTPVRYVYGDSAGESASAKITPTIGERAVDDDQYSPWDTNQAYLPLDNDSPNRGAAIIESSLRLCSTSIPAPYSISNCNLMRVVVPGEGVYRVVGFSVVFDPEPTFFGTVKTPVHYVYEDTAGESATAMITPTIGDILPVTGTSPISRLVMSLILLALSGPALAARRRRHT